MVEAFNRISFFHVYGELNSQAYEYFQIRFAGGCQQLGGMKSQRRIVLDESNTTVLEPTLLLNVIHIFFLFIAQD